MYIKIYFIIRLFKRIEIKKKGEREIKTSQYKILYNSF